MRPEDVRRKLEKLGIRATKIRGQNFLIDDRVLENILQAAEISDKNSVLEIGPGLGVLTDRLLERAGSVIAVELDQVLAKNLQTQFISRGLHLEVGDVRDFNNSRLAELCGGGNYKLVANIPYNITSKIIEKFLAEDPSPNLIVFLVQKEVAERIIAPPPKSSRLSIFVQYFGRPEIVQVVSRESFWPKPKVDSAILRIRRYPQEIFTKREKQFSREDFFRLVSFGFSAPRKKLIGNLAGSLNLSRHLLVEFFKKMNIQENVRAENLSVDQWLDLAKLMQVNKKP